MPKLPLSQKEINRWAKEIEWGRRSKGIIYQNVKWPSPTKFFREAFKNMNKGDFVYLDPPYAPETKTSFVGYTKDGFGVNDHEELFELTKNSGVDFVMSNANVNMVTNSFVDYTIKELKARRAINSKNPESTTTEVLVQSSTRK